MLNQKKTDQRFMALALMLGRQGLGRVAPNPSVGCVVVKGDQIVGRGRTADGGRPHAEVVALAQAGDRAQGATAYVTLEPCSHHGQSGPCSDALITSGVKRVVVATLDPNPLVSGRGVTALRAAGIDVDLGLELNRANADHAGFFLTQTENRPFVTLKLAMTLDGHIATSTGESQWITGPQARRMVHAMRAQHDAVMVGGGTIRADDPTLTVRGLGIRHGTARVVVSNSPLVAPNLQAQAKEFPVFQCHGPDVSPAPWATSIPCGEKEGAVDLNDALRGVAAAGITRVFCEGGGTLAASLLKHGLVDNLVCFQAGKLFGHNGLPAIGDLDVQALIDAPHFALIEQSVVDGDIVHRWRRVAQG